MWSILKTIKTKISMQMLQAKLIRKLKNYFTFFSNFNISCITFRNQETSTYYIVFINEPIPASFCSFSNTHFVEKTVGFSGIQTRIVGICLHSLLKYFRSQQCITLWYLYSSICRGFVCQTNYACQCMYMLINWSLDL